MCSKNGGTGGKRDGGGGEETEKVMWGIGRGRDCYKEVRGTAETMVDTPHWNARSSMLERWNAQRPTLERSTLNTGTLEN